MTPLTPLPPAHPAAASVLLAGLLAPGRAVMLREVARTRLAVHYETGDPALPVLCLARPEAVRLPNAVLTPALPSRPGAALEVGAGMLREVVGPGSDPATTSATGATWRVGRWWRPDRPVGLVPNVERVAPADAGWDLDPHALVGAGEGLTPAGDDLLAGALVAAHATGDPRRGRWVSATRTALRVRRTTAVSRGLLHHALDGWCVPELAAVLTALCDRPEDLPDARARLLAVGHSSGAALFDGVRLTLGTRSGTRPDHLAQEGAA